MHNWRILEQTILYDGSFLGLLSVIHYSISNKYFFHHIQVEKDYQDNLFRDLIYIQTDEINSKKVLNILKKNNYIFYLVYTAYLSGNVQKELIILKYIIKYLKYGNKIYFMKTDDSVIEIEKLGKLVKKESHRLKGFLRFKELENQVLFSEILPENNVIEILANHFKERLKKESWIIIDNQRNLAAIYDKGSYELINFIGSYDVDFSSEEEKFQTLWKNYFKTIAIKERSNKRCQMNFMPKKYWKYLVEDPNDKTY